jgi:aryl-alcohol dehydrogenase
MGCIFLSLGSGICHTDTSVWQGALPFPFPNVLGHEGGGVIEALPKDYSGPFAVGDTVLLSFTYCKSCGHCRDGYPAGCDMFFPLSEW